MLRAGENTLVFSDYAPPVDLSALNSLHPFAGEMFAVLDPPRGTISGIHLHVRGDGWTDPHTEQAEAAEAAYFEKEAQAIERIDAYEKDKSSRSAYILAQAAAEIAMAAHATWQKCLEQQDPGAGLDLRPDSWTVVCPGKGVPFAPGDRIMVAPYAPHRYQSLLGVPDVGLIGRDDPWADIVPMVWNPIQRTWELTDNWVAIKFEAKTRMTFSNLQLAETKKRYLNLGKVLAAGPKASVQEGQCVATHRDRCVLRPDNTKWFAVKLHPWAGQGVMLVREVDSDGVRRILGTITQPDAESVQS